MADVREIPDIETTRKAVVRNYRSRLVSRITDNFRIRTNRIGARNLFRCFEHYACPLLAARNEITIEFQLLYFISLIYVKVRDAKSERNKEKGSLAESRYIQKLNHRFKFLQRKTKLFVT